jgi:hypothetical protein
MISDVKFGTWAVAESPLAIEYSLVVIEEIRREVAEGFQKLSRGGIEVGGVLYGTREDRTLRLLAIRPVLCEHARGPSFQLSDNDRAGLEEQLRQDAADPRLEGMVCLGWYLSHTRSEIALNESDQEIFSAYFADPWQVTLVVRPGRGGSMRAGFFVREADGSVKTDQSYLEFNFPDRLAAILERGGRAESAAGDRRGAVRSRLGPVPLQQDLVPAEEPPLTEAPQFLAAPQSKKKWPWLVAWAVGVAALGVLGLRDFLPKQTPEPITLTVVERDGQLQIEWNKDAQPIVQAARGSLEIVDGQQVRTVPLSAENLALGRFTYQRQSGDVEVRLNVEDRDGTKPPPVGSRFLGQPPAKPADSQELQDVENRRDQLEAEIAKLRSENSAQAARIQQLERTLRILETRLGAK